MTPRRDELASELKAAGFAGEVSTVDYCAICDTPAIPVSDGWVCAEHPEHPLIHYEVVSAIEALEIAKQRNEAVQQLAEVRKVLESE